MKTPHHQKSHPKHQASASKKHPSDMEMHDPHFIIPPLQPGDPKPDALEKIKPPHVAIFLATRHPVLQVPSTRNPAPDKSFGYVGRFVKIADSDWKVPGTLVIRINKDGLGAVAAETLRIFRWNPADYAYDLIHRSALGQSRDYVWALIHQPGIYAVIGVNVDPLVLRTLVLLRSMRDLLPAMGTDRKRFQTRICELFICNPELRRRINDVKFVRSIVEENLRRGLPGRWPGGIPPKRSKEFYDNLCRICSALGNPSSPPELAILPEAAMGLPADVGEWSSVPLGINGAEILAVHAALILTGKVLYFAGSEHDENQHDTGQVNHTREWNPATNAIQAAGSPTHDLFCCGHAFLKNGKLVAAGGTQKWPDVSDPTTHYTGLRNTTIFNPTAPINTPWTAAAMMNFQRGTTQGGGRWYPTLVTLPNGRLFTMSGYPEETDTRDLNIMVEVYNTSPAPLGSWADLGDQVKSPLFYPRLHVLPDGTVFCSTPMGTKCKKCDPATGVWTDVCASPGNMYTGFLRTAVLLPLLPSNNYKPCILFVGHSQPKIIDLSVATPVWQNTGPRALAGNPIRNHACAVLLPNGKVLVTGGSKTSLDADAVLAAECYDPVTNTWETMASAAVPRLYHSVALLIPDGRVWSCGSNFNCGGGIANRELRMEQYKPPYLFLGGTKPVITNAPTTLSTIPGTFVIQTPQANDIQSVVMIRCGSVTHAFDADQRYVGLVIPSRTATSLTVQTPPNRKIAPPGYYMLFIIHTNGVPSVGRFIRIN